MHIGGDFTAILLDLGVSYFTRCLTFAPHLACLLPLPCP